MQLHLYSSRTTINVSSALELLEVESVRRYTTGAWGFIARTDGAHACRAIAARLLPLDSSVR
jgi:hypothetical protein